MSTLSRPHVKMELDLQERLRATALWVDGVKVDEEAQAYDALCETAARHGESYRGLTIGQVPGVDEARRLYRSFSVDPTRTRPSSEALLRRAMKGMELYRVNNVVDVGNWASLSALLPLGLYDRDHIRGDEVLLRTGLGGEEFEGIRKGMVHVQGRLAVADQEGAFGSPTSDSFRARIRESTQRLLCIVFAPADGDEARLERCTRRLVEGFERFAHGRVSRQEQLP